MISALFKKPEQINREADALQRRCENTLRERAARLVRERAQHEWSPTVTAASPEVEIKKSSARRRPFAFQIDNLAST